jgi:carbonic anhydrase
MGHSHCGAVTGALNDIQHGHLSQLVEQIKPAIKTDKSCPHVLTDTAKSSVLQTISDIKERSESIAELLAEEKISIIGAYYEVETGEVFFFE